MPRDVEEQLAVLGRFWNETITAVSVFEIDPATTVTEEELTMIELETPSETEAEKPTGRKRGALAALLAAAAVVGIVLVATRRGDDPSEPASPPVPDVNTIPAVDGALTEGTYRVSRSSYAVVDFTVTLPAGWSINNGRFVKSGDDLREMFFYPTVVDSIFADACEPGGDVSVDVGPSADDLARALVQQPGPAASGPVRTGLGGHPALRVDLTVPEELGPMSAAPFPCRLDGLQIWNSPPGDYFVVVNDGTATVYILDIDGQRQVVVAHHRNSTPAADVAELQTILDSIEFHP